MQIGVLSDTHLRSPDPLLEYLLEELFSGMDMILHAGDIVGRRVLERLEERGVLAVCGNMDDYEVADSVPQKRIISAGGKRIGLIHGWGASEGLEARVLGAFASERPDVVVYGHSHAPFWGKVEGVHVFNPGSPMHNRRTEKGTVGILRIDGKLMEGTIVSLDR